MGIGDWGLGIGAQSPIPNPQSPIPNPQNIIILYKYLKMIIYDYNYIYLIIHIKKTKNISKIKL